MAMQSMSFHLGAVEAILFVTIIVLFTVSMYAIYKR